MYSHSIIYKIKHYILANKIISGIALLIVATVSVVAIKNSAESAGEITKPTRSTLNQVVKVVGPVKPTSEADLAFEKTGTVSSLAAKVGDFAAAGQILATLSGGDAYAEVLRAKAALANQKVILEQLQKGATTEEIAVKTRAVSNAESNLKLIYETIPDSLRDVDSNVTDAIKIKISTMFQISGGSFYLAFSSCDQTLQSTIESDRAKLETALASYQRLISGISLISSESDLSSALENAYQLTLQASSLLEKLSNLLGKPCSALSSLDSYRTSLTSSRTIISSVFSDISAKRTSLNTAKNTLSQAIKDYELTSSGTDKSKLRAQEALVAQAEATALAAQAASSKNIIFAPFSGLITKVEIEKGETVSAGKTVITIISSNAFEVEAKVPEIDIAKVKNGNPAKITLDAYGGAVIFDGIVSRIEPSATLEGNVPMYKVKVSFKERDERIRSGMTANVSIITETRPNVLSLPTRFVRIGEDGAGTVEIVTGNIKERKVVTLGIRGENGYIEIISGITENDKVADITPDI